MNQLILGDNLEILKKLNSESVNRKIKPGYDTLAVKVVDNDGLENVEVIRVKVNGEVTRG